jgi:hypothetical protein
MEARNTLGRSAVRRQHLGSTRTARFDFLVDAEEAEVRASPPRYMLPA